MFGFTMKKYNRKSNIIKICKKKYIYILKLFNLYIIVENK